MTTIQVGQLKDLKELTEGGEGRIFRARVALPGLPTQVAYKEVLQEKPKGGTLEPGARARIFAAMEDAVSFRDALGDEDRQELDEIAAWPLRLVLERREPRGVIMRWLDDDFFVQTTEGPAVFEVQWLSSKESLLRRRAVDISPAADPVVRLAMLAKLVYAVARLHRLGRVYGDISLKNVAVAFNPPRIKLLDCDATAAITNPARRQGSTIFFDPPELQPGGVLQDDRSDVFKLALCIVRGLQRGPGITQARDPQKLAGIVDQATVDLLIRALATMPDDRPSARDLFFQLQRTLYGRLRPPTVVAASLDRSVVFRGGEVVVRWQVSEAESVQVIGPDQQIIHAGGAGDSGTEATFRPSASGPVRLVARNRNGSAEAVAGRIDLHDVPPFTIPDDWLTGLRPNIPDVPSIPSIAIGTETGQPVPRVDVPSIQPALDAINPEWMPDTRAVRLAESIQASASRVREQIDQVTTDGRTLTIDLRNGYVAEARHVLDDALALWRTTLHQQTSGKGSGP